MVTDTGSRADGNNPCSFPANNVVHQRRRVNPESLALRLGPDLVRDLDALITHGNTEMPSFAVRKELQERYNIDRRHIYDYFHSRGLRVVKEDKHGNPTTAKDTPTPLPNLRPLRQAPVKNVRSHPYSESIAAERKLFKPRGVTKAKPGRPKKNPPVNPKIVPITCETDESNEYPDTNDAPISENSPDEVPTPVYITVNPLLPHIPLLSTVEEDDGCTFNSVVNPLDESFSVRRALASAHRHKLVFERTQELTDYPVKLALTDDRSLLWNETSPCSAYEKGLLPHAKPLTSDERKAIYESMSDSLGPAQGIQECQGSSNVMAQMARHDYISAIETRTWRNNRTQMEATREQDRLSIPHWIQTLDVLFPAPGDALDTNNTMTDSPVVHTEVTRINTQARGVADECSAGGRLPFSVTSIPDLPITSVAETQQAGHAELHGRSGFPGTQEVKTRIPFSDMDSHPQWPEHVTYASHSGQRLTLNDTQRRGRNISSNARIRLPPCSPRKPQIRDLDRIWTRPMTTRDARRRTPSAAGDI
ncbi:hypothetical protein EV363DRAFT_1292678 [Boletus edulis]|nr:hypothetical protein EV363DRAFT_1292678 [Boletus edulis]